MATSYIPRLYDFLERLAANNDRQWFNDHKPEYEELRGLWLNDVDRLISFMAEWEPGMSSQTAKGSAYRIYRDTRFSSDKSPYKTFFSAGLSPWGRKTDRAAFYLEMSPIPEHGSGLYGGIWCVERPLLNKLRHAIVDNIEEWEDIVNSPDMRREFPDWCSSMLKTTPKGWDRNHPQNFFLRMTNYGKYHACDEKFFQSADWPADASEIFRVLKPMVDFLNYSIDE